MQCEHLEVPLLSPPFHKWLDKSRAAWDVVTRLVVVRYSELPCSSYAQQAFPLVRRLSLFGRLLTCARPLAVAQSRRAQIGRPSTGIFNISEV